MYANYYFTGNNGGLSKNEIFSIVRCKIFKKHFYGNDNFLVKTLIPFTCYAKYYTIANNAKVVSKNAVFQKFCLNFWKICLLLSIPFLVEDATPFHLICKVSFHYQDYFNIIANKIQIFCLKTLKIKNFEHHISVWSVLSAFTCYANYHFPFNNEVSKNTNVFQNSVSNFQNCFFRK